MPGRSEPCAVEQGIGVSLVVLLAQRSTVFVSLKSNHGASRPHIRARNSYSSAALLRVLNREVIRNYQRLGLL